MAAAWRRRLGAASASARAGSCAGPACKACVSDCPVNVDMASYKAEFLYQRYRWRLRPRWHYALGSLPLAAWAGGFAPGVANLVAPVFARLGGVSRARPLPRFARYRPFDVPA